MGIILTNLSPARGDPAFVAPRGIFWQCAGLRC